jgi:hypothetical protein
MERFCMAVFLSVLAGCAPIDHGGAAGRENVNIAEAVYRYQFRHNASYVQQDADAFFLKLLGDDPPQALMERFEGHEPPVKRGSDFETGKGLLFEIETIEVKGRAAEVQGGYYEGFLSSSGNTYYVERSDGGWHVAKRREDWIS